MTRPLHEGQHVPELATVAKLVAAQFPAWCDLAVSPVASSGTVNSLFRVGGDLVARFPLFPSDDPAARAELMATQQMVDLLASRVRVQVPSLQEVGEPDEGYPGHWSVFDWIVGETATNAELGDGDALATALGEFIAELRGLELDGRRWDGATRGGPLADRDDQVRACLTASAALIDAPAIEAIWDECVRVPLDETRDVWIHSDLMPGNLLVREGELVGVIDLEGLCVGDGAVDLMPAWNLLSPAARATFRCSVTVDDDDWTRGRGWAICQAAVALPYYVETNRTMAETARATLAALLT